MSEASEKLAQHEANLRARSGDALYAYRRQHGAEMERLQATVEEERAAYRAATGGPLAAMAEAAKKAAAAKPNSAWQTPPESDVAKASREAAMKVFNDEQARAFRDQQENAERLNRIRRETGE